jgi:hypothetical protein
MCRADPTRGERSKLVEGLAGQVIELLLKRRVCRALAKLLAKLGTGEPAGALSVRNDVGKGIAVDGQDDSLASLHRVDDAGGAIAKVADSYLHVLQRSIMLYESRLADELLHYERSRAFGGLDLDRLAHFGVEQGAADRGLGGEAALAQVGFG